MNLVPFHRRGLPGRAPSPAGQRGAALFISLMFLIILTLIGLSAANVGIMQERMAGNVRDTNVAFQQAEASLRAVEQRLQDVILGGGGGLGEIPIWAEFHDAAGVNRGDCAMAALADDLASWGTWIS